MPLRQSRDVSTELKLALENAQLQSDVHAMRSVAMPNIVLPVPTSYRLEAGES